MSYCPKCGTEVTGSFCQNCGCALNNEPTQTQQVMNNAKLNIMALIGFVIGCVSIFLNFWGIVGIVALVFSIVGLVQINNTNEKGKGFAIAGIALGGFGVLYGFIVILLSI